MLALRRYPAAPWRIACFAVAILLLLAVTLTPIETIALNHLLKYSGVDAASAFNERLIAHMARAADVERYLQEDDE